MGSYAVNDPSTNWEAPIEWCHMIEAETTTSGAVAAGTGDSGGPVYRFSVGKLYAVGIISMIGDYVPCTVNNNPARTCGSIVSYSAMSSVLNQWGLTLTTQGGS